MHASVAPWLKARDVAILGGDYFNDVIPSGVEGNFLPIHQLTIVAMGTSLPELVTSVVAARRGEHEIALSNLIGSNLFNVLAVLGLTSFVFAVPVDPRAISLDNWVMLGFSAALFPILWLSKHVTRVHGALLLAAFGVYFVVVLVGGG